MDSAELQQFKKIFKSIDLETPRSVKKWFQTYPELTIGEHCMIMEKSPRSIESLKKRCGLTSVVVVETNCGWIRAKKRKVRKRKAPTVVPTRAFDAAWMIEQYKAGKSLNWLRKACGGCSTTKVYNVLNTYGVKLRSHAKAVQSDHNFCNKAWLMENYINNRYSLRKCGEMAGVAHCTIRYWLAKFEINARSLYETGNEL